MSKLETKRFDAKLDSFLRRRLAQEEFERISTCEPCVILSPEDRRVHRHVVLGHRCLYLTEVPPKNLKVALHIKDISSIRMVDDLPDFLSGSEQENTFHVQINYKRLCKEKKFLKSKSPSILKKSAKGGDDSPQQQQQPHKSPNLTLSTLPLSSFHQLSISSSPTGEGVITRQGSSPSINSMSPDCTCRSHSSLGYYSPGAGKKSPQFASHDSVEPAETRSRSLSPVTTEDLYSYRRSPLPKHKTPPSRLTGSTGVGYYTCTGQTSLSSQHQQKVLTNGHSHASCGSTCAPTAVQTSQPHSSVQRRATDIGTRETAQNFHKSSSKTLGNSTSLAGSRQNIDHHSPSSSPELAENQTHGTSRTSEQTKRKHNSSTLTKHQFSSSPNFFVNASNGSLLSNNGTGGSGATSDSFMKLSDKYDSTMSLLSVASMGNGHAVSSDDECTKVESAVMDIYILKQSTDFYHQLRVAWVNVKINEVYLLEEKESPTVPKSFKQPYNHFSQKFCTLKQEFLTTAAGRLETSARLAQELCTASEKYFIIKRMFWEDSELFEFCLSQLKQYLIQDGSKRIGAAVRADQLEYSLILLNLFYQMMRETHLFSKKIVMLTRNRGQLLLDLAKTVVHSVPPPMSNDCEFADLDSELTEKSCAVLYEVIQVTQQARWPLAKKTNISLMWLVEELSVDVAMKTFCFRMVSYASHVIGRGTTASASSSAGLVDIGPGVGTELDPQAQVTLYHLATVINTLIQNSSSMVRLLRAHFTEEFRYFIRISKAQTKLPNCPLSIDIIDLLKTIKSKVLV